MKKFQLDLSAVIAVGNLENDLKNVLEIVSKCNKYGVEIILVLDNQSLNLRQELENQLTELKSENLVVTSGNWGNPGSPRNVGLALSSRKYIAFWDSDDMPNLEGIRSSLTELISTSSDAILGKFSIRRGNQVRHEPTFNSEHSVTGFTQRILSNPGLWRFIFKRDCVHRIEFPPFSSAEDQKFLQRFLEDSPKIIESY